MRRIESLFSVCLLALVFAGNAQAARAPGLNVMLREASRTFALAPGQTTVVAAVCAGGETVVGGSATAASANVTQTWSSLFYDGTLSGWAVEYRNGGVATVSAYASTGALCTAGTLTPASASP